MPNRPLYPHVPDGGKAPKARYHAILCQQSLELLEEVKMKMWPIEIDRAKSYGRTDALAVKAHGIREKTQNITEELFQFACELEEEGESNV